MIEAHLLANAALSGHAAEEDVVISLKVLYDVHLPQAELDAPQQGTLDEEGDEGRHLLQLMLMLVVTIIISSITIVSRMIMALLVVVIGIGHRRWNAKVGVLWLLLIFKALLMKILITFQQVLNTFLSSL